MRGMSVIRVGWRIPHAAPRAFAWRRSRPFAAAAMRVRRKQTRKVGPQLDSEFGEQRAEWEVSDSLAGNIALDELEEEGIQVRRGLGGLVVLATRALSVGAPIQASRAPVAYSHNQAAPKRKVMFLADVTDCGCVRKSGRGSGCGLDETRGAKEVRELESWIVGLESLVEQTPVRVCDRGRHTIRGWIPGSCAWSKASLD
jgi:hypothetical protein